MRATQITEIHGDTLYIRTSVKRLLLYLIGSLAFVLCGLWIVTSAPELDSIEYVIGGWGSIVFFGLGVMVFAFKICDRRPTIIINEKGVFDRTLGVGVIEWGDIEDVYKQSVHGNVFICMVLTEPAKYLRHPSKAKAKIASFNRLLGFETINLNLGGVGKTGVDRVMDVIKRRISDR